MSWEHFSCENHGTCEIQNTTSREIFSVPFSMGLVSTGKQRVYWGKKIILQMPGKLIVGKAKGSNGSYLDALDECNAQLNEIAHRLLVVGNSPSYNESAMSGEAGFGYVRGCMTALHIMSPCPVRDEPESS